MGLSFDIPGGKNTGKVKSTNPSGTVRPLPKDHKFKPGSILVPHVRLSKLGYKGVKRG